MPVSTIIVHLSVHHQSTCQHKAYLAQLCGHPQWTRPRQSHALTPPLDLWSARVQRLREAADHRNTPGWARKAEVIPPSTGEDSEDLKQTHIHLNYCITANNNDYCPHHIISFCIHPVFLPTLMSFYRPSVCVRMLTSAMSVDWFTCTGTLPAGPNISAVNVPAGFQQSHVINIQDSLSFLM